MVLIRSSTGNQSPLDEARNHDFYAHDQYQKTASRHEHEKMGAGALARPGGAIHSLHRCTVACGHLFSLQNDAYDITKQPSSVCRGCGAEGMNYIYSFTALQQWTRLSFVSLRLLHLGRFRVVDDGARGGFYQIRCPGIRRVCTHEASCGIWYQRSQPGQGPTAEEGAMGNEMGMVQGDMA